MLSSDNFFDCLCSRNPQVTLQRNHIRNQDSDRKIRISHSSMIRQRYKIYLCESDMSLEITFIKDRMFVLISCCDKKKLYTILGIFQ